MAHASVRRAAAALLCAVLLCGCAGQAAAPTSAPTAAAASSALLAKGTRDNTPRVLTPTADGTVTFGNDKAQLDASHVEDGYIMVNYTGQNPKVKLQLTTPAQVTYTYTLHGGWEVFPLTGGPGSYGCTVFENISGTEYSYAFSQTLTAQVKDDTTTYLYPNQYVNFDADCRTVALGSRLAEPADTDLEVVAAVYDYVVNNLTYDYQEAETVASGYLPDVDEVLDTKTGICFDYAAVMATMLRSQGIPTRLDVGWAGDIYHAWVSVYTEDTGWIDGIIEFDGTQWKRMDPTFASNDAQSKKIMAFISDDSNYSVKYTY